MSSISLVTTIPGPRSQALTKRRSQAVPRSVAQINPIFVKRAHGALIEDVDGNVLLDFAGGIGCVNGGHADPAVIEAIQKQSSLFLHTCFMAAPYESYVRLAERLNVLTPGSFPKRTFFVNSGAEAVENAVKIAREYTSRPAIICFDDAFHGRTYMAMSLTSKMKPYKTGFGPFAEDVYRIPYPNPYRDGASISPEYCVERTLDTLNELFVNRVSPEMVAAIIIEPVLGEGGFVVPPPAFLPELRRICDAHGIVLVADEIQTGFGRTGRMFACEHFGLEPDILLTAKSIASGMPIAGITGRAEIMDHSMPGALGGTFGGNPLACAAALATLDLFEREHLCERSVRIGEIFSARARQWQARFSCVGDVRGLGSMQAIELVRNRSLKEPATELTREITRYACEHGVILVTAGTHGNVIRLLAPLVISEGELNEGLDVIEAALHAFSPRETDPSDQQMTEAAYGAGKEKHRPD
ncbi:4-aminobutyrate--2-oxoglutarate transaminase [Paracidobacterium acidisoli]|uniref:4-aminobutyrate--2-oxoglutarate transaminase n=1 Tax=Paracidobacterium acidisoli TaxID=2303751 RepID=A0A372IW83_9BACT|nr:4-aminobutyrate--2-oxoglutarate transaminase [Paracidobacterium acidisoli]MBT9330129.1 4-aminobutyrate--2-oxoglutarate transaminase [Paracidobacterium acidisoli]